MGSWLSPTIGRKAHVPSDNIGRSGVAQTTKRDQLHHVAESAAKSASSDQSHDRCTTLTDRMTAGGTHFDETFRVQKDFGVLGLRRRRLAWVAFVALLTYAPVVAYLVRGPLALYTIPRDTWLLSATVAGLVGYVLIVDDVERRKAVRRAQSQAPAEPPAPAEEG